MVYAIAIAVERPTCDDRWSYTHICFNRIGTTRTEYWWFLRLLPVLFGAGFMLSWREYPAASSHTHEEFCFQPFILLSFSLSLCCNGCIHSEFAVWHTHIYERSFLWTHTQRVVLGLLSGGWKILEQRLLPRVCLGWPKTSRAGSLSRATNAVCGGRGTTVRAKGVSCLLYRNVWVGRKGSVSLISRVCARGVCVCDNEALYKLIITALEVESLGWATETISNIELWVRIDDWFFGDLDKIGVLLIYFGNG